MSNGRETVLADNAFLVSETDSKGNIIFANKQFCDVAEYEESELVGQPHNLIRHPDMPKAAFADLWTTVQGGNIWQGFVKNKTKSGGYYWVHAVVYPYKSQTGQQCYMSIRRKPSQKEIDDSIALYKTLH